MGVSIWEGGKAERFVSALESVAEKVSQQKVTIDDTAGSGDTDKVWSADKVNDELTDKANKSDTVLDTTLSRGRKANTTIGMASLAFGSTVEASGAYSHAEGSSTKATASLSHAEGGSTEANGYASHAEGDSTKAAGALSHAEGDTTVAAAAGSHAEGYLTNTSGTYSHAEGGSTLASGTVSHAEGYGTIAAGQASHASGAYNIEDSYTNWSEWISGTSYEVGDKVKITTTQNNKTTVVGYICKVANSDANFTAAKWNSRGGYMNFAEIIGNGSGENNRSNARTLDWDGNERLAGNVYVGCSNDSTGGTRLPHDVQINGVSVVNNGIANIPLMTTQAGGFGVARADTGFGTSMSSNGSLVIVGATDQNIKAGTDSYRPIVPSSQHKSVFYALAKLAGADMASSSNPVGTYTNDALVKIQKMLGIYEAPWELIREDTFTNATEANHIITVDKNGEAFALTDVILYFESPQQDTYASKGVYGQLWFHNESDQRYAPECGSWTQSAGDTATHACGAIIEQKKGMLFVGNLSTITNTNNNTIRYRYLAGFKNSQHGILLIDAPIAINKVTIPSVTGTGHYILYGKRKWT